MQLYRGISETAPIAHGGQADEHPRPPPTPTPFGKRRCCCKSARRHKGVGWAADCAAHVLVGHTTFILESSRGQMVQNRVINGSVTARQCTAMHINRAAVVIRRSTQAGFALAGPAASQQLELCREKLFQSSYRRQNTARTRKSWPSAVVARVRRRW